MISKYKKKAIFSLFARGEVYMKKRLDNSDVFYRIKNPHPDESHGQGKWRLSN